MKIQERLAALVENSQHKIEDIDKEIEGLELETAHLRGRRFLIEEEAIEARVALNFLQFHHLKVERNADGIVEASVDPVEVPA